MSRATVCLFLMVIFHTTILKLSQADETTTEGLSKNGDETATKPAEAEPAKESEVTSKGEAAERNGAPSKVEPKESSDVPQNNSDEPNKVKDAKANKSNKEDDTEKIGSQITNILPVGLKLDPAENAKTLLDFPKNFFAPVSAVSGKIGEAVTRSFDAARDLAGGSFNFLRSTVNSVFA